MVRWSHQFVLTSVTFYFRAPLGTYQLWQLLARICQDFTCSYAATSHIWKSAFLWPPLEKGKMRRRIRQRVCQLTHSDLGVSHGLGKKARPVGTWRGRGEPITFLLHCSTWRAFANVLWPGRAVGAIYQWVLSTVGAIYTNNDYSLPSAFLGTFLSTFLSTFWVLFSYFFELKTSHAEPKHMVLGVHLPH